jgi:predicted O-methyltransferase YrrM
MTPEQERWTAVDHYLAAALLPPDRDLESALAENSRAGLPKIDVSAMQGKLLHLIVSMLGARRILEMGTLGGYSTIWLAKALPPDGALISLEADPAHAEVARANIQRAGLASRVRIIVGRALDTLPGLKAEPGGPFDLVFIDADKPSTPEYFRWALSLSRPGSIIIADNVIRAGELVNGASTDERVQGMRRFIEMLSAETRVSATALQTVGTKGYDGFVLARVLRVE